MILPLELMAMRWLWLERGCHYIVAERAPRYMMGEPDVLGVTKSRHLIEIEIKRSKSDFLADFKKPHRANRQHYLKQQPRQFYYLMPYDIGEKVEAQIPEWAGLMLATECNAPTVRKIAPVNHESQRLSIKECVKLARQMTNHMMSVTELNLQHWNRYTETPCDPASLAWDKSVGFYEI